MTEGMKERSMGKTSIDAGARRAGLKPVGPRLAKLLVVVFALFALLCVNSVYLVSITILEWSTGTAYQNPQGAIMRPTRWTLRDQPLVPAQDRVRRHD